MHTDKHANDECPRCRTVFTCRVNTVLQCECMWLSLSAADLAYVRAYTELVFGGYVCLCTRCLLALQAEHRQLAPPSHTA